MIISHRHRFIFIKTTKCAGTSVEIALSRFCGPEDIITPISPVDEEHRKALGFRGNQNWGGSKPGDRRYRRHMGASAIRQRVGLECWESYFKFTITRNPFDRAVSEYFWRYRNGVIPRFSEFCDSPWLARLNQKGFGLYTINGRVAVDEVCRFENLESDLEAVRLQLGLADSLSLPQAKSGVRPVNSQHQSIIGEPQRRIVERTFAHELALHHYEF